MDLLFPTQNDIDQVLGLCPHVDKHDVKRHLKITNNVQETINQILDGNVLKADIESEDDEEELPSLDPALYEQKSAFENSSISRQKQPFQSTSLYLRRDLHLYGIKSVGKKEIAETKRVPSSTVTRDTYDTETIAIEKIPKFDEEVYILSSDEEENSNKKSSFGSLGASVNPSSLAVSVARDRSSAGDSIELSSDEDDDDDEDPLDDLTLSQVWKYRHSKSKNMESSNQRVQLDAKIDFNMNENIPETKNKALSEKGKTRKRKSPDPEVAQPAEREKTLALMKKMEREKMKAQKRMEKEEQQQERKKLAEAKKKVAQLEKDQKRVVQDSRRLAKPGECMKTITARVDHNIISLLCGGHIITCLQDQNVHVDTIDQVIENSITWTREVVQHSINNLQLQPTSQLIEEEEVCVILPAQYFVKLVDSHKQVKMGLSAVTATEPSLTEYCQQIKSMHPNKNLTLIITDLNKYFRDRKTLEKRAHRDAVLSTHQEHPELQKKKSKKLNLSAIVSRVEVEEACVDVQLNTLTNIRQAQSPEQVADIIKSITKAVAEIPFKKDRLKTGFSFHTVSGGGVKIDKEGHGLFKVWKQQLQQYKNVSPDIAGTIVAQYSSPLLLVQAYKRCSSQREAELMLQDITVRRGAGVLESSRRIGKELSRRVYQFMTSDDPDLVLK